MRRLGEGGTRREREMVVAPRNSLYRGPLRMFYNKQIQLYLGGTRWLGFANELNDQHNQHYAGRAPRYTSQTFSQVSTLDRVRYKVIAESTFANIYLTPAVILAPACH